MRLSLRLKPIHPYFVLLLFRYRSFLFKFRASIMEENGVAQLRHRLTSRSGSKDSKDSDPESSNRYSMVPRLNTIDDSTSSLLERESPEGSVGPDDFPDVISTRVPSFSRGAADGSSPVMNQMSGHTNAIFIDDESEKLNGSFLNRLSPETIGEGEGEDVVMVERAPLLEDEGDSSGEEIQRQLDQLNASFRSEHPDNESSWMIFFQVCPPLWNFEIPFFHFP